MASCNSTDILATAYRNGYAKLSSRDLMVSAIASACSTCNAQPLIEAAIGLGYLKLSEFDAAMCIAESLCSSPGVTAAPAPTILKLAMQDHLAAMSRRDLDGVIAALLCKMTNPPCVTPSTPGTPAAFSTLNNILKISWSQPPNSGSLILNYTVSYGTTQGGPYASTVTVPAMTKQAILNGLTSGTTYYFVVKANSFSGCSSANSAEGSATTGGAPPSNGLLNSLTHYWTLDVLGAGTYADSLGTYAITASGGVVVNPALINAGFAGSGGNLLFTGSGVDATWQFGPGVSLTMQIWFSPAAFGTGFAGQNSGVAASSAWFLSTDAGGVVTLQVWCSDATTKSIVLGTLNLGVWNQVIAGYDSTNKLAFGSINNGARATVATTADLNQVNTTNVGFLRAAVGGNGNGSLDEIGWWKGRVLSTANVTTLYNGGAGLPFSSFQP